MAKKKTSRIRQTRTEFQKVFDQKPGMIQSFSWMDNLPEVLHISIALLEYDYEVVKKDFHNIADFVRSKHKSKKEFHFNLSHTIKLVLEDESILVEIRKSCFKAAFDHLLTFYIDVVGKDFNLLFDAKPELLVNGFRNLLDNRSDNTLLCKYMMLQYIMKGHEDPSGLSTFQSTDVILQPQNVSFIMAAFPPSVGLSENIDPEFCHNIWMYNYFNAPFISPPNDSEKETAKFREYDVRTLNRRFKNLFHSFQELNLIAVYNRPIAEVHYGFVARIGHLALEVVDLIKHHKGEIAEIVLRVELESVIMASWMLKRRDPSLYQRYREYSIGREKFMYGKTMEKLSSEEMIKYAKKSINQVIKEAGTGDFNVAIERGDIFDFRIDQMAEEVWGKDNIHYFLYKRLSEVTHGNWNVVSKYHLEKSLNPMHHGLYDYSSNPNKLAGLVPAFSALMFATEFILLVMRDINNKELKRKIRQFEKYSKTLHDKYLKYFNETIIGVSKGEKV